MKFYLLEKHPENREYDSSTSLIVRAENSRQARKIASEQDTYPGSMCWESHIFSTIKEIKSTGNREIVHVQTMDG